MRCWTGAAVFGALCVHSIAAYSAPLPPGGDWTLSAGMEYTSGDYGAAASTDILYLPFSAQYATPRYRLKITVPLIHVDGPAGVVYNFGNLHPRTRTGTNTTTNTGVGDVLLQGSMNLYAGNARNTLVDLTGKVKLGTADRNKNLGTGENDYFLQVDGYQTVGKTTWFGSIGYAVLGDPPGVNLKNVPYLTVGGSRRLEPDLSAGAMFYTRDAVVDGGDSQQEISAFLTRHIDLHRKIQVYALLGLASGGPDYGMGATFSYRY